MNNTTNDLKQAFLEADKQYLYAVASGDGARMLQAIKTRSKAFDAYNKAKKQVFRKFYKYVPETSQVEN